MDVNFPLVLVILCFAGIVIWLFDRVALLPGRREREAALKQRYPRFAEVGSADQQAYAVACETALREPVLVEMAKSFLPVLLVVLVLRSFLVEPFKIPSSSMEPTLEVGDFILVNKYTYGLRLPVLGTKVVAVGEPKRGDVMVFFPPNDNRYFIKRVVGLPGDRIQYINKQVYINGERVEQKLEAWLPPEVLNEENLSGVRHTVRLNQYRPRDDFGTIEVPAGHYFMMGDNRDNSSDSRVWGFVPEANIVGRAFAVWMHWDSFWSLPAFDRVGIIQ